MPNVLAVPHRRQETRSGCLPACVQMVLAYQGIVRSQAELGRLMGTHPLVGTPYSHIVRLRSAEISVAYQRASELDDLAGWLARELPVIAFVQMRELPHWQGHWSQHAVVVVGLGRETVHILDPAAPAQVIAVASGDFLLAWEEMDLAYAVIARGEL
jgi:ABC-type bacteriocin/lantibiotic exporter with double-glycine peptidase domain